MDFKNEIEILLGKPESEQLEYKAVLPPPRSLAQMIASFANSEGGSILLGVAETSSQPEIIGLSEDFNVDSVINKAINLLSPKVDFNSQFVLFHGKRIYLIKIAKSRVPVTIEGKIYVRKADKTVLKNPNRKNFSKRGYKRIEEFSQYLDSLRKDGSGSKAKFIDHYQSILNIFDEVEVLAYPNSPTSVTNSQEGKILIRILFSSCADNLETYLSDLLSEIYLANPATLKSNQTVTIKEVLDCQDMQEFVTFWVKRKLGKLQRGSVKGFIAENTQIKDLNVLDEGQQDELERILQIRHLYAHRNGIVDDKFLQFIHGEFRINEEHQMTIEEIITKLKFLSETVDKIDKAAVVKYRLATIE